MSGKPFSPSEYDIWLGQNIAATRIMFGMSQKDLARRVGVSFQQIQKYETGGNRLSALHLKKIADAFEMTVGQLIGEGITCKYPHDKDALTLLNLLYSKITTPEKRELLLKLAHCIAEADFM